MTLAYKAEEDEGLMLSNTGSEVNWNAVVIMLQASMVTVERKRDGCGRVTQFMASGLSASTKEIIILYVFIHKVYNKIDWA